MIEGEALFCIRCGAPLEKKVRFGRQRPACSQCDWVLFPDPKVAVAALVFQDDHVLLVRRVNEPYQGKWSLPAGFMDAGEKPETALARECFEETGLNVRVLNFHQLISGRSHPNGADLLLVFLAEVVTGEVKAGDDADDARFFSLEDLPELAFDNAADLLRLIK